jgi:hypothetical protein
VPASPKSSSDFLIACERAQGRIGELAWSKLPTSETSAAIYRELRDLDAGREAERTKKRLGALVLDVPLGLPMD